MAFSGVTLLKVAYSIVYDPRTQNLKFIVPMPKQIWTITMQLPEVSGGTLCVKRCRQSSTVTICSVMGATNLISRAPTVFRSQTNRDNYFEAVSFTQVLHENKCKQYYDLIL